MQQTLALEIAGSQVNQHSRSSELFLSNLIELQGRALAYSVEGETQRLVEQAEAVKDPLGSDLLIDIDVLSA